MNLVNKSTGKTFLNTLIKVAKATPAIEEVGGSEVRLRAADGQTVMLCSLNSNDAYVHEEAFAAVALKHPKVHTYSSLYEKNKLREVATHIAVAVAGDLC